MTTIMYEAIIKAGEAIIKAAKAIKMLTDSLSRVLGSSIEQTKEKPIKASYSYYKTPKNQYLEKKVYNSFGVERRIQKHLPYHRHTY